MVIIWSTLCYSWV